MLDRYHALGLGQALEIVTDREPTALFRQLQTEAPGNFAWRSVRSEPSTWTVVITKLARTYSSGECCGVCGGGLPNAAKALAMLPAMSRPSW